MMKPLAALLLVWAAFAKAQTLDGEDCVCSARQDLLDLLDKWETGSSSHTPKMYWGCREIKAAMPKAEDGLYIVMTEDGEIYQTFCNMSAKRGGWTPV